MYISIFQNYWFDIITRDMVFFFGHCYITIRALKGSIGRIHFVITNYFSEGRAMFSLFPLGLLDSISFYLLNSPCMPSTNQLKWSVSILLHNSSISRSIFEFTNWIPQITTYVCSGVSANLGYQGTSLNLLVFINPRYRSKIIIEWLRLFIFVRYIPVFLFQFTNSCNFTLIFCEFCYQGPLYEVAVKWLLLNLSNLPLWYDLAPAL